MERMYYRALRLDCTKVIFALRPGPQVYYWDVIISLYLTEPTPESYSSSPEGGVQKLKHGKESDY